MNRTTMRLAGLTLLGALAVASEARAVDANTISAVDVSEKDGAVELVIKGSRAPSYTVFKLQEPPRLVVQPPPVPPRPKRSPEAFQRVVHPWIV